MSRPRPERVLVRCATTLSAAPDTYIMPSPYTIRTPRIRTYTHSQNLWCSTHLRIHPPLDTALYKSHTLIQVLSSEKAHWMLNDNACKDTEWCILQIPPLSTTFWLHFWLQSGSEERPKQFPHRITFKYPKTSLQCDTGQPCIHLCTAQNLSPYKWPRLHNNTFNRF